MLITPKRIAKFFYILRIAKIPCLPFILNVEPGNICNLKCPLCPTGADEPGLKKGFLGFKSFKNIFDQLKGRLSVINLFSWGEPLLNKDLPAIIEYAKSIKPGIRIATSTNLNIRDKKVLDELIESGIDEIIVSCDGATAEVYEKYRIGGDFALVMENLEYLSRRKKELKKNTAIIWNFIVFKHNEHQVELGRKMAAELGVTFKVGLMRTSMKDEILKPHKETIKKDLEWIPDNPLYSAYDKKNLAPKKIIKSCRKPWQEITVNWNGEIFPCCAVYGDKYSLGDATTDSINEIWNNEEYISCRQQILDKKLRATTVCGICRNNQFMHM